MQLTRIRHRIRYSFFHLADGKPQISISKTQADGVSLSVSIRKDESESYRFTLTQDEFIELQSRYTDALTRWSGKAAPNAI